MQVAESVLGDGTLLLPILAYGVGLIAPICPLLPLFMINRLEVALVWPDGGLVYV